MPNTRTLSESDKQELTTQFAAFRIREAVPARWGVATENVSGNQIFHSKGVDGGFDVHHCEDVSSVMRCYALKNSNDATYVFIGEELHEVISVINSTRSNFGFALYEGIFDTDYTTASCNSHDLFGCVGLRRKEYCILNRQYSKDEYHKVRRKLIAHMTETGEWGEFFPSSISPFPYDDSMAQDLCPLDAPEMLRRGLIHKTPIQELRAEHQPASRIPNYSSEADESICSSTFDCENCGRGLKLQKTELRLLQSLQVPIPHICFECRHLERMSHVGSIKINEYACASCHEQVLSCCIPESANRVLCEHCYLNEINSSDA